MGFFENVSKAAIWMRENRFEQSENGFIFDRDGQKIAGAYFLACYMQSLEDTERNKAKAGQ